jgi:hypothetical protein
MPSDPSEAVYAVVITGVNDESTRKRVAQTLTSVSDRLPMDRVLERLNSLPWTITRKATLKKAMRLVKLLEGLGAQIRCIPPLPGTATYDLSETLMLPGTELLSQTQVMSATQFIAVPDEVASPTETSPQAVVSKSRPVAKELPTPPEPPIPEETAHSVELPKAGGNISQIVIWLLVAVTLAAGLAAVAILVIEYLLPELWA